MAAPSPEETICAPLLNLNKSTQWHKEQHCACYLNFILKLPVKGLWSVVKLMLLFLYYNYGLIYKQAIGFFGGKILGENKTIHLPPTSLKVTNCPEAKLACLLCFDLFMHSAVL